MRNGIWGLGLGSVLLALSGCGGHQESVTAGRELACPSGTTNAGNSIITMDCNTVVQYQGNEVQGTLAVKDWVNAGLSSAPEVLREVDHAATESQVQFTQVCRAYNSCQVRGDEFNRELARTQEQFRVLREKISLLQASGGNPAVLRSTITEIYTANVPEEKRYESTLAMNFTVQARDAGSSSARVVRDGETLKTGTQLVFGIEVNQAAHTYVFQKHQSGEIDVLFPNSGVQNLSNPLPAKSLVRVPPAGQVFTLNDEDLGEEHVYIVVSKSQLSDLNAALSSPGGRSPAQSSVAPAMKDLFEQGKPECEGQSRGLELAPEDKCGTLSRGLDLASGGADPFFQNPGSVSGAATPGDEIIVKTFSFKHVP